NGVCEACDAPEVETPAHAERRRGQNPARARVPRVPSRALGRRKTEVVRDETEELTVATVVAECVGDGRADERDQDNTDYPLEALVLHRRAEASRRRRWNRPAARSTRIGAASANPNGECVRLVR